MELRSNYCEDHVNMYKLEDETLVKAGDRFDTKDDFVNYVNDYADRWYYYYSCWSSTKSRMNFVYRCVFRKPYGKKQSNENSVKSMKTECPCKVYMRQQPGESWLTVMYACNHHDHELSKLTFQKLQHGRRIPPALKQEIFDMYALGASRDLIKRYLSDEIGNKFYFKFLDHSWRQYKPQRYIPSDEAEKLANKIVFHENKYGMEKNNAIKDIVGGTYHKPNACTKIAEEEVDCDQIESESEDDSKMDQIRTDMIEFKHQSIQECVKSCDMTIKSDSGAADSINIESSPASQIVHEISLGQNFERVELLGINIKVDLELKLNDNNGTDKIDKVNHNPNNITDAMNLKEASTKNSNSYCHSHSKDLLVHKDDSLVKVGDTFESIEKFVNYLNKFAKKWCYYYSCACSIMAKQSYYYKCVYSHISGNYAKKGLRNRDRTRTNCPCRIFLKKAPDNNYTVVSVCNHHDHPLTVHGFMKLQHGRRVPADVKEEVLDLLFLDVRIPILRKYVEDITGIDLGYTYFYYHSMKLKKGYHRMYPMNRLKELRQKIQILEAQYSHLTEKPSKQLSNLNKVSGSDLRRKSQKSKSRIQKGDTGGISDCVRGEHNTSRLETCLQSMTNEGATLISLQRPQGSIRFDVPDSSDNSILLNNENEEERIIVDTITDDLYDNAPYIIESRMQSFVAQTTDKGEVTTAEAVDCQLTDNDKRSHVTRDSEENSLSVFCIPSGTDGNNVTEYTNPLNAETLVLNEYNVLEEGTLLITESNETTLKEYDISLSYLENENIYVKLDDNEYFLTNHVDE